MKHTKIIRSLLFALTAIGWQTSYTKAEEIELFSTHFARANELFKQKKPEEAIIEYNKTIAANPRCHQAYFNRGLAFFDRKDLTNAQASYRKAIALEPNYTKAHLMLGELLKKQNKTNEAIAEYRYVLKLDSNHFDAHLFLARALTEMRKIDEAVEHFEKAMSIRPHDVQCKLDFANALNMTNKTEQALTMYFELEVVLPNDTAILYNIAYTFKKLGRIEEAFPYYHRVLKLNPNHAEGHFGLGLSYLMTGNFKDGWREYEWRWSRPRHNKRNFKQPVWDGSDLYGKTILLHAEQGLGDTYQFIRFAKTAKERGATVIVAVQNPLVKILSQCDYIDIVVSLNDLIPPFDTHIALMSVPLCIKLEEKTIPTDIPYLYADQNLVDYWEQELAHDTNFKIGICWQGNPNYSTPFLRQVVAEKSMNVLDFAPIATLPGVTLYCLQKTTGEEQLNGLPEGFNLHVFGKDFDNVHGRFMDTAAIMKNIDLMLTVDTSIGHLAGGLGVTTWLMLPEPADWRWMFHKDHSPWYPNMRLFRQPQPGDWKSVIQDVARALAQEFGIGDHTDYEEYTPRPADPIVVRSHSLDELDFLRADLKNIDEKLQHSKEALIELEPHTKAFAHVAHNVVKLFALRTWIRDKIKGA